MWIWASSISILPSTPLVSPTNLILTVPTKQPGFPTTTVFPAPRRRSSFAVPAAKAQETEETAGNEKQGMSNQLRGLDVLWAMQKVAAVKTTVKKNRKRNGFSAREESSAAGDEEVSVDYNSLRPVRVQREWGAKLDGLERRLRRLSEEIN